LDRRIMAMNEDGRRRTVLEGAGPDRQDDSQIAFSICEKEDENCSPAGQW
jgi:hypothetical protein